MAVEGLERAGRIAARHPPKKRPAAQKIKRKANKL